MNSNTNDIVVVSGLPRSGTSLCMRMLEAGGMPVLVDNIRTANDDNPNGYYEFEPVKTTRSDGVWLRSAGGKAVKMIYRLLYDLPSDYRYRVLFMRRDIEEILASQQKMLLRERKQDGGVPDAEMRRLYEDELARFSDWVRNQRHIRMLVVSYNHLLETPMPVLQSIDEFLDNRLDVGAMFNVIDPALYRNRCDSLA
jgi:hypothetical protein